MNNQDTIAAIATAPGEAGLCIIRISGRAALDVADRVFLGSLPLSKSRSHTVHYGKIVDPSDHETIDEVLVTVMRAPRTFTCEDVVEISGHGGHRPGNRILGTLLKNGARLAEPGEFTKRAFLNGRLDLLQAEAVAELIRSRTDSGIRAGLRQLSGEFSQRVKRLRADILSLASLIEVGLDFTEEDIDEISYQHFGVLTIEIVSALDLLIDKAGHWRSLRDGVRIVIVGRPNVGKSSLLNRFVGDDRAIVDPMPGTTRDTIEVSFDCRGVPVSMVDTAGIRPAGGGVESKGIDRTLLELESADLYIWVVDGSEQLQVSDTAVWRFLDPTRTICVINKSDMPVQFESAILSDIGVEVFTRISALNGNGCEAILDLLYERLTGNTDLSLSEALVNVRHMDCLRRARVGMCGVRDGLRDGLSQDIVAHEVKGVLGVLDELLGTNIGDDLLDQIFSSFCIGK
ncbi:MAG: tRNA uridine-5-carboxymethylaminomethyl(34) synthesis GTPase MnmE [Candidatus Latescibacteria bacterium]|nr:tRNA uridine-5-carboxymethylaminomethyl(34) synthesis GTPase MnmE [Candidatus Latescibacterota bacterium]